MLATAGVDIGSTTSKVVVLIDGEVGAQLIGPSTTNPARTAQDIYDRALQHAGVTPESAAFVVGTGYGRTQVAFAHKNVSEITCHGRGAHHLRPAARTVIDIGGQDTKVIRLDTEGNLLDFVMNSKCAAGTGRFLEAMARSMELPITELEAIYFGAGEPCLISHMCSVFAESEVINLINDGVALPRIVKGLLRALAHRVSALGLRIGIEEELVMTGGVAKSRAVRDAVAHQLGVPVAPLAPADPQLTGALGAALIANDFARAGGPSA